MRNQCPDLPGYANVDAQKLAKEQPPAGDDNSSTGSNHGQEASKSASHEALESTDRRSASSRGAISGARAAQTSEKTYT